MSEANVSFTVTRTKADYFWAVFFTTLRNPRIWMTYAIGALLGGVISASIVDPDTRGFAFVTSVVVIVVLYCGFLMWSIWAAAAKNWKTPGAFAPVAFTVSPEGMAIVAEHANAESKWALWKSAFETRKLIIVRHHLGLVQLVPKRDLDGGALTRLRALLRAALPGKTQLDLDGAAL